MKQATQFIGMKLDLQRMLPALSPQCVPDIIMLANHIQPGCHLRYRHRMIMMAARMVIVGPCLAKVPEHNRKYLPEMPHQREEQPSVTATLHAQEQCAVQEWVYKWGGGVSGPQVPLAGSDTSPCVDLLRQHCNGQLYQLPCTENSTPYLIYS